MTMNWKQLLSDKRFRNRGQKYEIDARNAFEDDTSRIIFSSAFRRLQDKTQVFPLERDSLVRTRLTHSIEVSNIGRSIGLSIEGMLLKNHAIEEDEIEDLIQFDGNVQTFRHLIKLQFLKDKHSYNLSFPTLATIAKYPCSSKEGNKKKEETLNVCLKKFGFFQSEKKEFKEVWDFLGIPEKSRFPLTIILEAADDIAYSANDLEDGVRKNIINSETFLRKLETFLSENRIPKDDPLVDVHKKCQKIKENDTSGIENCIIEQFRIEAHSRMIQSAVEAFLNESNYRLIMEGAFTSELLEKSKAKNIREFFSAFARKDVFSNKDVLKLELMGEVVICGLLDKFFIIVEAEKENLEGTKTKEGKIFHLISDNFRYLHKTYTDDRKIDRIQLINDYICGMTDSYALQTYRKLTGIEL
jgi:dGTPase